MIHIALGFVVVAVCVGVVFVIRGTTVRAGSLTLSGTVYTPTGAVYTGGGNVNMWGNNWSNGGWIDSTGHFEIGGISAGTYTMNVAVSAESDYSNSAEQQVTITSSVSDFSISVAATVVRGILATPDGTPTNGCVTVRDSTWTINRGYCTVSNGSFKIGAIPAGTYVLEKNPPSGSEYVSAQQTFTVTDPSTVLNLGTVRLDTAYVIGKVALPDGSPLPWSENYQNRIHLSVDLWNNDRTVEKHSDYDSTGTFRFGYMPAGTYIIHVNVWDTELYTGSANTTITVPAGGVDLSASPIRLSTPQLSGVVYRPDGVTPVQSAWVWVYAEGGSEGTGSNTDQNGKYRIGGLTPGAYKANVNPPNNQTDMVRIDSVDVTITSSLTTRNFTFSAASKYVRGTVKRSDGTVVPCANVQASRRDGVGWAGTTTASDGSYSVTVTPGSWSFRVEPNNSFSCPTPNWIFLDSEVVVDFSNDGTSQTETVNFTVQKATAKITGTVTLKNGGVLTNGNVNANSQTQDGRNRWSNAQIKANGSYTLNLIGGTYELNVWTQDSRYFVRNQKVAVAENETKTVDFVMSEKLAHITGTVTDKAGRPLERIQLNGNLDCGPNGCAAWSNTRTDANGYFDMAATAGRWNLNFDSGQGVAYVYDGPQMEVYVPTETSTVTGVNFALTYADVTIRGNVVDENGRVFSEFPGWAFVRPTTTVAGAGYREFGGSVNRGAFSFRAPSNLFSQAEIGVHTPQNSKYSAVTGVVITLIADATIEQNITIKQNDAAIVGRLVDTSGLPLEKCNFQGEVFANRENSDWHGTQINPDCTFELSLLAGRYQLGYHMAESAGFLNRPMNETVNVASDTRLYKEIKVTTGDARLNILVLKPDGSPAPRVWVNADNHREIDEARRNTENRAGKDSFKGVGGTKSPEEMFKYCTKKENEKECRDATLPSGSEGPGGCKNAWDCAQYCKKNAKKCDQALKPDGRATSSSVKLSGSVLRRKAELTSLKLITAQAEAKESSDIFDNQIQSGGETNDKGVATISLLSGHTYSVHAGPQPGSTYMPPKEELVDFTQTKNANVTLTMRKSDGKMTGFVFWKGVAVRNGWVGCWSEDGNHTGSQIINGTYSLNYTFQTVFHCNANAFDGTKYLNSDETIVVIEKEKTIKKNFNLDEAAFQIPPDVSESFSATEAHVITLSDGTTVNIPANTLATSGTVTVNASPTINFQSQKTAQPIAYAYQLEALDSNYQPITTFKGNITMCFKYSSEQLAAAGADESSLASNYWDSASGSWKLPPNATHDKTKDTICISSNHFTSYAVVTTAGKGRGKALTSVSTSTKKGVTKVTIGSGKSKKTITPFPSYTAGVQVTTFIASKKAGQVIVAAQSDTSNDATIVKIYTVKGKLTQTIKPWGDSYKNGASLVAADVTKNAYDDLIVAPKKEASVRVYDLAKNKEYGISIGRKEHVIADAIELKGGGLFQLATAVNNVVTTWDFTKGSFKKYSFDQRRLRVNGFSVERVRLVPSITSVSPASLAVKSKGTATLTISGENLGSGSTVLIGQTIAAKVKKATGETSLTVTVDYSRLAKKKNYSITVINPDGEQTTFQSIRTK
jgi:hypothetical protein